MKVVSYELASELLKTLKNAEDYLTGWTTWTPEEADSLIERVCSVRVKAELEMVKTQQDSDKLI